MILTSADIARVPIDRLAIEMVPEAVGREHLVLPIAVRDGRLHLVLPADSPAYPGDLHDTLRFVLNQNFTYQLARVEVLRPYIDLFYSAVSSEIAFCGGSQLKFRCPRRWVDLEPTDNVRVRHCGVCERQVTFCTTLGEYQQLASERECVAYFDGRAQCDTLGMPE